MGARNFAALLAFVSLSLASAPASRDHLFGVRDGLHFSIEKRAENIDGSVPLYKNPSATVEDRVNDLLPRMTVEEKVSQMSVLLFSTRPEYTNFEDDF